MPKPKPAPRKLTLYAVPRLFEIAAKQTRVFAVLARKRSFKEDLRVIVADAAVYKVVRRKPAKKAKKKGGRK